MLDPSARIELDRQIPSAGYGRRDQGKSRNIHGERRSVRGDHVIMAFHETGRRRERTARHIIERFAGLEHRLLADHAFAANFARAGFIVLSIDIVGEGERIQHYDPEIGAWRSTWIGPFHRYVRRFIARRLNDEVVLELLQEEPSPVMRWIFHDIQTDSFAWRNEVLEDGKWRIQQRFSALRCGPGTANAA